MRQRTSDRDRSPATGERAAISGYSVQYRTSAALTLAALRDESLEWIALVDPEAGRLDDFQLARPGRLDAYQVKFSSATGAFTYTRLRNIIGELADGWDRLRKAHPDREVFAHLHTSRGPSQHGPAGPVGEPKPSPKHLAAFLDAVWIPVQSGVIRTTTAIPAPWLPVWEALRAATPFGRRDFMGFVRRLLLDLGQEPPDPDAGDLRVDPDLRRRFQELLWVQEGVVTDPSRSRITRTELLQELGWAGEFEFRSVHEFGIRRDRYARIATSADELLEAISNLPGGYVSVIGTPGSGKSTLLTDTFYGHPAVVARYYAYVPDNEVGSLTRASATNFLHDVVLSLDRAGIQVGQTPVSFDPDVLAERLRRQLRALGERFKETGEPAFIVVDGLDHVDRVLPPRSGRETLLDRLPDPAEVPDGVFLIVGTQRTDVAPEPVRAQLADPVRVVEMSPLDRVDVSRLASESGLVPAGSEDALYSVSNGHPLIVGYLLSGFEGLAEEERVEWLEDVPRVDGDVLALYRAYWSDVASDDETVYALAHIARWRGAIDLEWFATWLNPVAIQRIRRTVYHLFRRERNERWYFFHESFRVFLLDATIQSGAGEADHRIALRYHRKLAEACAQSGDGHVRWEELHHLIEAGDQFSALTLADPALFRTQAQALRALPAIADDIREATRVAVAQRDLVALARLMISASELNQREYHLSWSDSLPLLLIDLDEEEIALDHLRGDFTLRESKDVALEAALELHLRGYEVEAKRLFDLAEPVDLLRNQPEHYSRADAEIETLFAWSEVAPRFVALERVVAQIEGLSDASFGHRTRGNSGLARYYRAQLRATAGIGALGVGSMAAVDELLAQFEQSDGDEATARALLVLRRFQFEREDSAAAARQRLEDAFAEQDPSKIASWARVEVAETLLNLGDLDGGSRWLEALEPPAMSDTIWRPEGARPFMPALRFFRLRAALGDSVDPQEVVREPEDSAYALVHGGWRAIVRLASCWGAALRGAVIDTRDVTAELRSVIASLDRRSGRDDLGWYAFEQARPAILALLVRAADATGEVVLEAIQRLFLDRWLAQSPPDDEEVRRVLMAFLEVVGPSPWISETLAQHEPTMLERKDVGEQINACFAQTRAWLRLGERDAAMRNVLTGVARAAGVGYRKDYQLNDWIELMAPMMREPEGDVEIDWLARSLTGLDESTEGRASALAAEELLKQTSMAHPGTAVRIMRTLPQEGVINDADALAAFLTGLQGAEYDELAWLCLSELLVSSAHSAESAALRAIVSSTDDQHLPGWLRILSARISVHAVSTTRLYWRRAIAEVARARGLVLEDLGLTAEDIKPSERAPKTFREEGTESERGAADEATNAEELIAAVEQGAEPDYRLEAAISRLADDLSAADVSRLRAAFGGARREPLILARLARRLVSLGDTATARELAEEALALGRLSGWTPYIDGGTRIRPLEALAEADPGAARARFWTLLGSDAADDGFNVGGLLDSFPQIIAIADPSQALPIALEVRDYVHVLLEAVPAIRGLAGDADFGAIDIHAACAWVLVDCSLASDVIRGDAGARGAMEAVNLADDRVIEQLRETVEFDPTTATRVLHIVAAVALTADPNFGVADATSAIDAIAAASEERSVRELADAFIRVIEGKPIDTASLEGDRVALVGLANRPSERPAEIGGAAAKDVRAPQWLDDESLSTQHVQSAISESLVLGEFTRLTRLSWELPTVLREQAAVRVVGEDPGPVPFLMNLPMVHYHRLAETDQIAEELRDAIVFRFTEPGDEPWSWLGTALSPSLARTLGWRPSSGLFAWEDTSGNPTCWSVWWRDGHRDRKPPSFEDVVGEGWLVLGTPAAVAAIRGVIGPIERLVEVTHMAEYRSESVTARLPVP